MMSEAIDTCCTSMPSTLIIPNVIARVSGIASAISSAERHSQKPSSATMTTRTIASIRLSMNRSTLSSTCRGWSEVRAKIRSSGSRSRTPASTASTSSPNSPILAPARISTLRVTARLRSQRPLSSGKLK